MFGELKTVYVLFTHNEINGAHNSGQIGTVLYCSILHETFVIRSKCWALAVCMVRATTTGVGLKILLPLLHGLYIPGMSQEPCVGLSGRATKCRPGILSIHEHPSVWLI